MERLKIFLFFSLTIFTGSGMSNVSGMAPDLNESAYSRSEQDTPEKQILYNGRAWRNLYSRVKGDQYLFTSEFKPGTVTINSKLFKNLEVRYDIYNDEVLIKTDEGIILQLNKEMVNSFTMDLNNKTYDFIKLEKDSLNAIKGYVNVLYRGNVSLLVKYRKEILLLAEENKYDVFRQIHRIYIRKDGTMYPVNSKNDIFDFFSDNKQKIRGFIKTNKIKVTRKNPDSFVPIIDFCNGL